VSRAVAKAAVQAVAKASGASSGDKTLYVRVPAVLDPDAPIAEAVEKECDVEQLLATRAYRGMRRRYDGTLKTSKEGDRADREIRLTILEVSGVGPGGWTRKTVRLRADLVQRDELVASAVFDRGISGRGMRRACTVLGNAAVSVGGQIGAWASVALGGTAADAATEPEDDADEAGDPKSKM
jgi:hypothetical protein